MELGKTTENPLFLLKTQVIVKLVLYLPYIKYELDTKLLILSRLWRPNGLVQSRVNYDDKVAINSVECQRMEGKQEGNNFEKEKGNKTPFRANAVPGDYTLR